MAAAQAGHASKWRVMPAFPTSRWQNRHVPLDVTRGISLLLAPQPYALRAAADMLIVPTARAGVRSVEQVGHSFLSAGYSITTIAAKRFHAYCQTFPDGS
jgi:hypothetical protein